MIKQSAICAAVWGILSSPAAPGQIESKFWEPSSPGCIGFCATLTAPAPVTQNGPSIAKTTPEYANHSPMLAVEASILNSIVPDKKEANLKALGGYALNYIGVDAQNMDLGSRGVRAGIAVLGRGLTDAGQNIVDKANKDFNAKVLSRLNLTHSGIIAPDGTINAGILAKIKETDLAFIQTPAFWEGIGDKSIAQMFVQPVQPAQLFKSLQGITKIEIDMGAIDGRLKTAFTAIKEIKAASERIRSVTQQSQAALKNINNKLSDGSTFTDALARLPPSQKLALIKSGALSVSTPADLKNLESAVRAEKIQGYVAATKSALRALGPAVGNPELADAISDATKFLDVGGEFAAAIASGNPVAILQGGIGVFNAVFGSSRKAPEPTFEQKMLSQISQQLADIQNKMFEYHREEMQLLGEISSKIDRLEVLMAKNFKDLAFDIALIQFDTRELLFDDVRACDRLSAEFEVISFDPRETAALSAFRDWFLSDGRPDEFSRCIGGLISRQTVDSEIDFSGILRSVITDGDERNLTVDQRRNAVRNIEQLILQPTADYVRRYNDTSDSHKNAKRLYTPAFSVCDLPWPEPSPALCKDLKQKEWPAPAITQSQFNPGQGSLLSASTAISLAQYTRLIAQWGTVLKSDGGRTEVLSDKEAQKLTLRDAANRTRHLLALRKTIATLDLNIGQTMLLGGTPSLSRAADILSSQILPAYAQAMILGNRSKIDELLPRRVAGENQTAPNCSTTKEDGASNEAWDTLCLMQTNALFAENVLKVLVARRLIEKNASWEDWRKAVRDSSAAQIQKLIGNDVIIVDIRAAVDPEAPPPPKTLLGAWAIELPRVNSHFYRYPEKPNCWNTAVKVPDAGNASFYSESASGRCYALDGYTTASFAELKTHPALSTLAQERAYASSLLKKYCDSNKYYPKAYCQ